MAAVASAGRGMRATTASDGGDVGADWKHRESEWERIKLAQQQQLQQQQLQQQQQQQQQQQRIDLSSPQPMRDGRESAYPSCEQKRVCVCDARRHHHPSTTPPPSYDDAVLDTPPDYSATDALAHAQLPSYSSLFPDRASSPTAPPRARDGAAKSDAARIDFSSSQQQWRQHGKRQKARAKNTFSYGGGGGGGGDDDDEKKKDGEGENGEGGGTGGGSGGAGSSGGAGDGGDGDKGDGDDDWPEWDPIKKGKKGKKAKEEEEEAKKKEEVAKKKKEEEAKKKKEEAAAAATAGNEAEDDWDSWDGASKPSNTKAKSTKRVSIGGAETSKFDDINLSDDAPKLEFEFDPRGTKSGSLGFGIGSGGAWGAGSSSSKWFGAIRESTKEEYKPASDIWGFYGQSKDDKKPAGGGPMGSFDFGFGDTATGDLGESKKDGDDDLGDYRSADKKVKGKGLVEEVTKPTTAAVTEVDEPDIDDDRSVWDTEPKKPAASTTKTSASSKTIVEEKKKEDAFDSMWAEFESKTKNKPGEDESAAKAEKNPKEVPWHEWQLMNKKDKQKAERNGKFCAPKPCADAGAGADKGTDGNAAADEKDPNEAPYGDGQAVSAKDQKKAGKNGKFSGPGTAAKVPNALLEAAEPPAAKEKDPFEIPFDQWHAMSKKDRRKAESKGQFCGPSITREPTPTPDVEPGAAPEKEKDPFEVDYDVWHKMSSKDRKKAENSGKFCGPKPDAEPEADAVPESVLSPVKDAPEKDPKEIDYDDWQLMTKTEKYRATKVGKFCGKKKGDVPPAPDPPAQVEAAEEKNHLEVDYNEWHDMAPRDRKEAKKAGKFCGPKPEAPPAAEPDSEVKPEKETEKDALEVNYKEWHDMTPSNRKKAEKAGKFCGPAPEEPAKDAPPEPVKEKDPLEVDYDEWQKMTSRDKKKAEKDGKFCGPKPGDTPVEPEEPVKEKDPLEVDYDEWQKMTSREKKKAERQGKFCGPKPEDPPAEAEPEAPKVDPNEVPFDEWHAMTPNDQKKATRKGKFCGKQKEDAPDAKPEADTKPVPEADTNEVPFDEWQNMTAKDRTKAKQAGKFCGPEKMEEESAKPKAESENKDADVVDWDRWQLMSAKARKQALKDGKKEPTKPADGAQKLPEIKEKDANEVPYHEWNKMTTKDQKKAQRDGKFCGPKLEDASSAAADALGAFDPLKDPTADWTDVRGAPSIKKDAKKSTSSSVVKSDGSEEKKALDLINVWVTDSTDKEKKSENDTWGTQHFGSNWDTKDDKDKEKDAFDSLVGKVQKPDEVEETKAEDPWLGFTTTSSSKDKKKKKDAVVEVEGATSSRVQKPDAVAEDKSNDEDEGFRSLRGSSKTKTKKKTNGIKVTDVDDPSPPAAEKEEEESPVDKGPKAIEASTGIWGSDKKEKKAEDGAVATETKDSEKSAAAATRSIWSAWGPSTAPKSASTSTSTSKTASKSLTQQERLKAEKEKREKAKKEKEEQEEKERMEKEAQEEKMRLEKEEEEKRLAAEKKEAEEKMRKEWDAWQAMSPQKLKKALREGKKEPIKPPGLEVEEEVEEGKAEAVVEPEAVEEPKAAMEPEVIVEPEETKKSRASSASKRNAPAESSGGVQAGNRWGVKLKSTENGAKPEKEKEKKKEEEKKKKEEEEQEEAAAEDAPPAAAEAPPAPAPAPDASESKSESKSIDEAVDAVTPAAAATTTTTPSGDSPPADSSISKTSSADAASAASSKRKAAARGSGNAGVAERVKELERKKREKEKEKVRDKKKADPQNEDPVPPPPPSSPPPPAEDAPDLASPSTSKAARKAAKDAAKEKKPDPDVPEVLQVSEPPPKSPSPPPDEVDLPSDAKTKTETEAMGKEKEESAAAKKKAAKKSKKSTQAPDPPLAPEADEAPPASGSTTAIDDPANAPVPPPASQADEATRASGSTTAIDDPTNTSVPPPDATPAKKERPKVVRNGTSWGLWGASPKPASTPRVMASRPKPVDATPAKEKASTPARIRVKSTPRKTTDKDADTKSTESEKQEKPKAVMSSRPKPPQRASTGFSFFSRAPPQRSKSTRETQKPKSGDASVDGGTLTPTEDDVPKMPSKAAKLMGVRESRKSASKTKDRRKSVPDPYAIDSEVLSDGGAPASVEAPTEAAKKLKRRSAAVDSLGLDDNGDGGPFGGVNDTPIRPKLQRAATMGTRSAQKPSGGLMSMFGLYNGRRDYRTPAPTRPRSATGYESEGGAWRPRRPVYDGAEIRQSRRNSRRDPFGDEIGAAADAVAATTDAETEARRAARRERRAERERKELEEYEAKKLRVREAREREAREELEREARRREEKRARRAVREERRVAEEKARVAEEKARVAEERARVAEERALREQEAARDRDAAECRARRKEREEADGAEGARSERRASEMPLAETTEELKLRKRRERRLAAQDGMARPYLHKGSDKTSSWVDQINAEPPLPPPVEGTVLEADPDLSGDHEREGADNIDEEERIYREMKHKARPRDDMRRRDYYGDAPRDRDRDRERERERDPAREERRRERRERYGKERVRSDESNADRRKSSYVYDLPERSAAPRMQSFFAKLGF